MRRASPLLALGVFSAGAATQRHGSSAARSTYPVDVSATGPAFAGVGAQSTAGSARLLIDYPAAQRDAVLDLLFAPQFGASLHHLKVEIGGDA